MTIDKIRSDCLAALKLPLDVKEIIFATTAPDATQATNAAYAVQQELRAQGHDVRVVLYGWEALTQLIAQHPAAYATFNPETGITAELRHADLDPVHEKLDRINTALQDLRTPAILESAGDGSYEGEAAAIHVRIDTFRDLGKDGQPRLALDKLTQLEAASDLTTRPYAAYRILTVKAAQLFELGEEDQARDLWETAYQLRPDDPKAISNRAMAYLAAHRYDEAVSFAQRALESNPSLEQAVGVLLQAAARSSWQGDPWSLIPAELKESAQAALGLIEFLRWRDDPAWMDLALRSAETHEDRYFKNMAAYATLVRALSTGDYIRGGDSSVSQEELSSAGDTLKAYFDDRVAMGYANYAELATTANNVALTLRLAHRFSEAVDVLQRAIGIVGDQTHLIRLLGIVQGMDGDVDAAIATLARAPEDYESRLARAEMLSATDRRAALAEVLATPPISREEDSSAGRSILLAELSLWLGERDAFRSAVDDLASRPHLEEMATLFEIVWDGKVSAIPRDEYQERLSALAARLTSDTALPVRIAVADRLQRSDQALAASRVLEGHVDLTRISDAARIYLEALASGRRDEAFIRALDSACVELRHDPSVIWIAAAHAWNCGDFPRAEGFVDELLARRKPDLQAHLLKLDILARQDRIGELQLALNTPLEDVPSRSLNERFRLIQLLQHFGFIERAAKYSYRLFLEYRDQSRAWMALVGVILGRGRNAPIPLFEASTVRPDSGVNLQFGDGTERFIVIEPEETLRRLDSDAIEPEHPLALAVLGLGQGDTFQLDNRSGTVTQVRSKYIARFQAILEEYEARFPNVFGFKSMRIDPEVEGGMDEIIASLKEQREHAQEEVRRYDEGDTGPLAVLAYRMGSNVIDAAAGVAQLGYKLKVALGTGHERVLATRSIRAQGATGCIMDTLTFWTAYLLDVLDDVIAVCGPIHLTQSTVDELLVRRERLSLSSDEEHGVSSMHYEDGRVALVESSPESVGRWREQIQGALDWINANAIIEPVATTDDLPDVLVDFLRDGKIGLFDEVVVSVQKSLLFVSDDGPLRELAGGLGVKRTAWLQHVLAIGVDDGAVKREIYLSALCELLHAGQKTLGVSAGVLILALEQDAEKGCREPGKAFCQAAKELGGATAEMTSHVQAVKHVLSYIWNRTEFADIRLPATGILLRELIKFRHRDYVQRLGAIRNIIVRGSALDRYFVAWLRGHFIQGVD